MAFRMTGRVLGAVARERNDVQPALRKVWKAHEPVDGLVIRSISPYQLNLVQNFVTTIPKKLKTRFIEYGPEVMMCVGLVYGIYTSHKKGFAQLHKDHRD
ncbi:unnamed protein product [Ectocarpus sp. 6 AP-2014]